MNKEITHADDLIAWLYGIKAGLIKDTRYQINPDDSEINSFCKERHAQCIKGVAGVSVSFDNNSATSQLTNAVSTQNEEAIEYPTDSVARKSNVSSTRMSQRKTGPTKITPQSSR
jgi:hypothetical protein